MPSTRMKTMINSELAIEKVDDITADTFELTDKVDYNDFIQQNIPEEIIFPEELNRFLRDQIRELTSENGCLRRSLDECEEKLISIGKSNSVHKDESSSKPAAASVIGVGKASEIAASKIIELSKKCRDQTSEIEVLKSKCKKLESKLQEKNKKDEEKRETKLSLDSGDGGDFRPFTLEDDLKNKEEEIKTLQDKIQQTNSKLYESKNACTSLRQELNKAQKLLCREVGETLSIANLSSHQSGWKGRAEQIQQLQNKLIEYEGNSNKGSCSSAMTLLKKKRNVTNFRKIEKERRQKSEDLTIELRQISIDLEVYKRKHDAAKARVKVLENDFTSSKQSILLLNEKRSHDEELIRALNGQLKAVEDKYRDREKEILKMKDRAENECMKICSEVNRLQASNENLKRTIEERETEIDSLRSGTSICGKENSKRDLPPSRGRRKTGECCSNGEYNEYVTLGMAAEAERERLLELVIVLNRRLDEERFTADKIGETLRGERSKLARLETKLQRLEMEKVGMSKINTGYNKPRSSKSTLLSVSGIEMDSSIKEEMRFRLELLEEESLALKTRLATIQRDKASDLAMYKQMLDQARKTFQDAYRGKPTSSSYSTVTI